jgi:hypothetical protein
MASPHVTGAIAVIQDAAQTLRGRRLAPDAVKALLTRTAAPLTKRDVLWDFPCGAADFLPCGSDGDGFTGVRYARWQAGAGGLDLNAALAAVAELPRR